MPASFAGPHSRPRRVKEEGKGDLPSSDGLLLFYADTAVRRKSKKKKKERGGGGKKGLLVAVDRVPTWGKKKGKRKKHSFSLQCPPGMPTT